MNLQQVDKTRIICIILITYQIKENKLLFIIIDDYNIQERVYFRMNKQEKGFSDYDIIINSMEHWGELIEDHHSEYHNIYTKIVEKFDITKLNTEQKRNIVKKYRKNLLHSFK